VTEAGRSRSGPSDPGWEIRVVHVRGEDRCCAVFLLPFDARGEWLWNVLDMPRRKQGFAVVIDSRRNLPGRRQRPGSCFTWWRRSRSRRHRELAFPAPPRALAAAKASGASVAVGDRGTDQVTRSRGALSLLGVRAVRQLARRGTACRRPPRDGWRRVPGRRRFLRRSGGRSADQEAVDGRKQCRESPRRV